MSFDDDFEHENEVEDEEDYDVALVASVSSLDVPESGTATFNVKLSGSP